LAALIAPPTFLSRLSFDFSLLSRHFLGCLLISFLSGLRDLSRLLDKSGEQGKHVHFPARRDSSRTLLDGGGRPLSHAERGCFACGDISLLKLLS
jgi:hypothetical protein